MESPVAEPESSPTNVSGDDVVVLNTSVQTAVVYHFVNSIAPAIQEHQKTNPGQRLALREEFNFRAWWDPVPVCGLIFKLISRYFGYDCDFRVTCGPDDTADSVCFMVDGTFESNPNNAAISFDRRPLDQLLATALFYDRVIIPKLAAKREESMGFIVGFQLIIHKQERPPIGTCDNLLRSMIAFGGRIDDFVQIKYGLAGDMCISFLSEAR